MSYLCFTMRQYSQQPVNSEMQDYIRDDGDDDREQQSVSLVSAGARNYSFKRCIERVRHGDNKLHEARAAAGSEQRQ